MDVLGALVKEFFARFRGCKYQDTEWQSDSREDTHLDGRSTRLGTDRPEEHGHVRTLEPRRKEDDRTAWGSYTERAPPILPAHTWIPGFEDELLLAARRQYNELDGYNSDEGDSEGEHHSSQDDGGSKNGRAKRFGDPFLTTCRRVVHVTFRLSIYFYFFFYFFFRVVHLVIILTHDIINSVVVPPWELI
ncbi:hypothetical protein ACEPAF_9429 [Sanghuangporus sanghuang]